MNIFKFSVGSEAKRVAVRCVFAIGVVCWANFAPKKHHLKKSCASLSVKTPAGMVAAVPKAEFHAEPGTPLHRLRSRAESRRCKDRTKQPWGDVGCFFLCGLFCLL